jgi:4-amino-4-deoxy-L-arabinose transferase-like glycosyltransferase
MELPIYNFIVATAYQYLGFSHIWPRLLSLFAGAFGILGVWFLTRLLIDDMKIAYLAAWTFAWSPLFYFYSYKIQPDIFGYSLSIWGVVLFNFLRRIRKTFHGIV